MSRRGFRLGAGLVAILGVALVGLAVWALTNGSGETAREAERDAPTAVSRVSHGNGAPVITLDAVAQRNAGIATIALKISPYQQELRAYSAVLHSQPLTEL